MTELGNVKQFTTFANQQFPGGSLFLLLSDTEFKRFMMQLSSKMLDEEHGRRKNAARLVGENKLDEESYWLCQSQYSFQQMAHYWRKENLHFCGCDV